MGLQQNLNNIQTNLLQAKTAIAQSISNKGVECSADEALSTYASKIDSITTGSTGGTGDKIMLTNGTKFGYSKAFDPTLYDVSNVTDMSNMFGNCSGLTSELDLSEWDVSSVTNMSDMFNLCSALTNIDVSTWDVSSVTNMSDMFNLCSRLTNIDVSTWDVSNVTDMSKMFNKCSALTNIDVSTWDVSSVTNMNSMFYCCSGLTNINLSTWDVSSVTSMFYMFSSCPYLASINLSTWDVSSVTNMNSMFLYCTSLTNLQLNDLGHNQSCTSLDLSTCSALTKDSILFLFNNAFDRATAGYTKAFTITLNATTKALLTEDEIAIATNKGFTVV